MVDANTYPRAKLSPCLKPASYAYTWPWHLPGKRKKDGPRKIFLPTRYACQEHLWQVFNTCLLIVDTGGKTLEEYLQVIELRGGELNPEDYENGWPLCHNCNPPLDVDPRTL